ncbi:MAG: DMT family transporter [Acidimicrobiia bacterium]
MTAPPGEGNHGPEPGSATGRVRPHGALGSHRGAFGASEWGLVALVAAIWGSSFLFIAIAIEGLRPGLVVFLRIALGALTLAVLPGARVAVPRSAWPRVAALGVIWMAVPFLLFPIAEQWVASSVAGMINGAMPVAAAVVVAVIARHRPARSQAIGIAVGFAGIVCISLPELVGADASPLGVALIVVAVICYAVGATIAAPLQQEFGTLPVVLRGQLVALVVSLPGAIWAVGGSTFTPASLLAMVPLGVLGSGVAFVAMVSLVGRVGADRGSIGIYFVPVVALTLGVVVHGEPVHAISVVGCGLVIAGAWLASRSRAP